MEKEEIKKAVREGYGKIARGGGSCCGPSKSCGDASAGREKISKMIGYDDEELKTVPGDANLGLGCGNPIAIALLKEGETVLDLGSGAGLDCFLSAKAVGEKGKVIGVDMTTDMLDKARKNAAEGNYKNVEFRLGEIENLPVANDYVDVVISNCVINLASDKKRVFEEAFRVLKPGGRIVVSDVVYVKKLPQEILEKISAYVGCIAGALKKEEYIEAIKNAGFSAVSIMNEKSFPPEGTHESRGSGEYMKQFNISAEKIKEIAGSVLSITVTGNKPPKV